MVKLVIEINRTLSIVDPYCFTQLIMPAFSIQSYDNNFLLAALQYYSGCCPRTHNTCIANHTHAQWAVRLCVALKFTKR